MKITEHELADILLEAENKKLIKFTSRGKEFIDKYVIKENNDACPRIPVSFNDMEVIDSYLRGISSPVTIKRTLSDETVRAYGFDYMEADEFFSALLPNVYSLNGYRRIIDFGFENVKIVAEILKKADSKNPVGDAAHTIVRHWNSHDINRFIEVVNESASAYSLSKAAYSFLDLPLQNKYKNNIKRMELRSLWEIELVDITSYTRIGEGTYREFKSICENYNLVPGKYDMNDKIYMPVII